MACELPPEHLHLPLAGDAVTASIKPYEILTVQVVSGKTVAAK
jgi:hypothetical protein